MVDFQQFAQLLRLFMQCGRGDDSTLTQGSKRRPLVEQGTESHITQLLLNLTVLRLPPQMVFILKAQPVRRVLPHGGRDLSGRLPSNLFLT
ncbi:hypothetical protein ED92_38625 [Amycolatopsis sp. MJM2582]|nr:hypothetical protein ED92_38625 [Amycolatopsis sp. MJM2582]